MLRKIVPSILLLVGVITTSCTSKSEKAIVEYLKTEQGAEIKLYDLKEEKKITVSDSLDLLRREAEDILQKQKDSVQAELNKYKSELSDGAKNILNTPTLRDAYATVITRGEMILDSLSKVEIILPDTYQNMPSDKVLAIIYSAKLESKQAPTTYFEVTPDEKVCLGIIESVE